MSDDLPDPLMETARKIRAGFEAAPLVEAEEPDESVDDAGPSDMQAGDSGLVAECASLDQSDTDNALRLRRHMGDDLIVMAMGGASGGDWLGWVGTHWDFDNGAAEALKAAQKLGGLIGMEAAFLEHSPQELADIRNAQGFSDDTEDELGQKLVALKKKAAAALARRRTARRAFGVSSKNLTRINAMLALAAPHLRRPADAFNADLWLATCKTHTMRFRRVLEPRVPGYPEMRMRGMIDATPGHRRADLITAVLPVDYDPEAKAPLWRAALARFLPDEDKRRTVQQFTGLSLLGIPMQKLMFHYGLGGNFKSVFLETIFRLCGEAFAVSMPAESLSGVGDRGKGGASPDIARLFGKRMLRVAELPKDKPLDVELIKRLTGGEKFAVRTLFKGYFEFMPLAKVHMSSNGKPIVDGGDFAIFRRLLLVHWTEKIEEAEQRNLDEVVNEFLVEKSGILNWMIEGVLDYLTDDLETGRKGGTLHIADSVRGDTEEYRQERDPIGEFIKGCIEDAPGHSITAQAVGKAYGDWCLANGRPFPKSTIRVTAEINKLHKGAAFMRNGYQHWRDLRLVNVPTPDAPQPRYGEDD
jgi:putative DNA primase/helicase